MNNKFKNRYRIKTSRLNNWDYSRPGFYYVTICAHNRAPYFGDIIAGKMVLSEIGKIAQKYWLEIIKHYHKTNVIKTGQ